MLEFVEQLTYWRGDVDRESLINALREAAWPPHKGLETMQ